MMTRKDYQLIAEAIRYTRRVFEHEPYSRSVIGVVVHALASDLKADNPNFDIGKFLAAASDQ